MIEKSKSIWHSKNEIPQANKDVVEHWINCYDEHCYSMWKQRPDGGSFDSHTIAWCYLNDLLACEKELIDTKKKLDIAVNGITYMRNNCLSYAADYMDYADKILEQINNKE